MKPFHFAAVRAAAAITATDDGPQVDLSKFSGNGHFILNSSACTGADNTSSVKLQHSLDGTTWTDTGLVFANVTNSGPSLQTIYGSFDVLHKYVRAVNTLAGTTPGVTYSVEAVADIQGA
ncbi:MULTISPECIES: hypothetical protein [unclassified Acidocella]|uniref:hypothetical protein n=1 Tax=unclassified Acidocella TaxID=2648610 RepID=UPI00028DB62B|nr:MULTISPECIES: hypothetical protein [unclassified Acidocella]EKN01116.1 hypothetical protein MXAZACID_02384 [Acidocella sp. MX-AZ02]WBO60551.1 discoidin domain-containing protein [Acidocella sp. MX-AZ03]